MATEKPDEAAEAPSSGQYVRIYPDISDVEETSGPDMSFGEEVVPDNINKARI